MTRRRPVRNERSGFVLPFVVLMLFAISVTGATGYLIVNSEFSMAKHSRDGAEALAVARAGLERFVAEQIGVVGDSISYALGDGVALVTTRKLFAADSVTDYYYVRSEGTVTDIFAPNTPARRVVGAYAIHRRRPLAHHSIVILGANVLEVDNGGSIDAEDRDSPSDCPGGGATTITGGIARVSVIEDDEDDIEGNPDREIWPGGTAAILDSIGLRWDVLSDPDFPVDYHNTWPNFSSLPSDSFPVVRRTGWVYTNVRGRGLLIIDGMFDPGFAFHWDGIILAGDVDDIIQGHIDGLFVGNLDGVTYPTIEFRTDAHYHSCDAYSANETLSYLELIENTVFEAN